MLEQKDFSGLKFNKLTVISNAPSRRTPSGYLERRVIVKCKCGYEKQTTFNNIIKSKRCSYCNETINISKYKEENITTRLKSVYASIKVRCNNPNSKDYKNYGGRGIKIEETFDSFDKFYEWMILQGYTYNCKLEIDRKDNNGNYSIENCQLVTKKENNRNMRRNVMNWELVNKIRIGEYKDINSVEIANIIGCSSSTILSVRNFDTWVE